VIDQVVRILNGTPVVVVEARWDGHEPEDRFTVAAPPSEKYQNWVKEMLGECDAENAVYEYGYDEGIAP